MSVGEFRAVAGNIAKSFGLLASLAFAGCHPTHGLVDDDANILEAPGDLRLTPAEFQTFLRKAQRGDVGAMHTLAVHYISGGEATAGYRWLAEAGKRGDCHAVILLAENTYHGISADEVRW